MSRQNEKRQKVDSPTKSSHSHSHHVLSPIVHPHEEERKGNNNNNNNNNNTNNNNNNNMNNNNNNNNINNLSSRLYMTTPPLSGPQRGMRPPSRIEEGNERELIFRTPSPSPSFSPSLSPSLPLSLSPLSSDSRHLPPVSSPSRFKLNLPNDSPPHSSLSAWPSPERKPALRTSATAGSPIPVHPPSLSISPSLYLSSSPSPASIYPSPVSTASPLSKRKLDPIERKSDSDIIESEYVTPPRTAEPVSRAITAVQFVEENGTRKAKREVVNPKRAMTAATKRLQQKPPAAQNPFTFINNVKSDPKKDFGFVYMTYMDMADYHPYNLKIVPHADVDQKNFFTMSASGVTHFINGVAEFTTLDQWIREYEIYAKVKMIPIFRKYKMWKLYTLWRKNVRNKKMSKSMNSLKNSLFILHPKISSALLQIRSITYNIGSLRLCKLKDGTTYSLEEFSHEQDLGNEIFLEAFSKLYQQIKETAQKACEESLQLAGLGIAAETDRWEAPLSSNTSTLHNLSQPAKSSSSTTAPLHYAELAAKRNECRRLTNFIKLTDYLIVDTLHNVALHSAQDVQSKIRNLSELTDPSKIENDPVALASSNFSLSSSGSRKGKDFMDIDFIEPKDPKKPLYRVDLYLNRANQLTFAPTNEEFSNQVDAMISKYVSTVLTVNKLITNEDFRTYTQPAVDVRVDSNDLGEGLDLKSIITDDPLFQNAQRNTKETIGRAYEAMENFCAIFDRFLHMYLENLSLDLGSLPAEALTLDYFRSTITKFKQQIEEMKKIPVESRVGIVLVDSNKLKDALTPSPDKSLAEISHFIPRLAHAKNEELLSQLTSAIQTLSSSPKTVEEFVENLNFLREIQMKEDEIRLVFNAVTDMYKMMEAYNVRVPDEEYALYQTLSPTHAQLGEAISNAIANKEFKMEKFIAELDKDIAKLRASTLEIRYHAQHNMISTPDHPIEDTLEYINELMQRVEDLKEAAAKYTQYQEIFKVTISRYEELEGVYLDLLQKKTLWQSLHEWSALVDQWAECPLESIDSEQMSEKVQFYTKVVFGLERSLPTNLVVPKLKSMVESFKMALPIVLDLRNPGLKQRHWDRVQEVLAVKNIRDKSFTLGNLLDLNVIGVKELIGNISLEATKEGLLEEMIKKLETTWGSIELQVTPHGKDSTKEGTYILGGVEDIFTQLDDSQVVVGTIKGSRYIGPVKSEAEHWDQQLSLCSETLEEWITCQRDWMYLDSIFSASDIQRQLPTEYKLFLGVDKSWKEIMRATKDNPNALQAGTTPGLLQTFQSNNSVLEKIHKSLEEYLETKRLAFPRFYFLSNDELLEILAQTRNPLAVQVHLRKCFDNLYQLEFTSEPRSVDVVAMLSAEGERVGFPTNVKARGSVESWLSTVEGMMKIALQKSFKTAIQEYEKVPREEWIMNHPAQIVLAVSQIFWAREITKCLSSTDPISALEEFKILAEQQLNKLAALVRGDLTHLQRGTLMALITIDVHARDIVASLIEEKVCSETDFGWTRQLRYYWRDDNCMVLQANASFKYGYEYLGCTPRLVITPLTDRCYVTLTGALHLKLGGAPSGPAGTGKTETVKDLAKALAKQCVVFNCSDGLDYKMMGKFFSGQAQAGAWCCFDEFNRIDIEVLSVIAQQVLTIRSAMLANVPKFIFEGKEIRLNPTCGFFITMNPGYAGRTELPDNLKSLFRPVAMMVPDYRLIAEIILFSEGFESARILSQKMVQLYKLSSEQLSQQDHYDFGMRAVKSVLVMAGALKRANPHLREDIVLIRALRDSNIPKFLADDIPLFMGILSDLFPGIALPEHDYGQLEEAIHDALVKAGLQPVKNLIVKVIQLYETMLVRHGVMLVGGTMGGKTTCYRALASALTSLSKKENNTNENYKKILTYVLNPKCISRGELYGQSNPNTQEWTDGLAAEIVRKAVADTSDNKKWVVFDGPVDALWIENMNTVLDDNKTLCLSNGERIKLNKTIQLLFEVENLAVASPATVSRCGMVYMQPSELGWRPFVLTWLNSLPEETLPITKNHILSLFDAHVTEGLVFIRSSCRELIPSVDTNLVSSLCSLFKSLFTTQKGVSFTATQPNLHTLINLIFVFSYTWSIGGNLDNSSQEAFDGFGRKSFENLVNFPGNGFIYDYCVDYEERVFKLWDDMVPNFVYSRSTPYFQMIVPTADTVRYTYLLDTLVRANCPILLTGFTGVGKSVITNHLLAKIGEEKKAGGSAPPAITDGTEQQSTGETNQEQQPEPTAEALVVSSEDSEKGFQPVTLMFSAQTSSIRTQQIFETKLEKKRKNLLGAPVGKSVVMFVDDVNMPALDEYGAQPPIELLRHFLDFGGLYDRRQLFWKDIQDVNIVAACAPPGGGRNNMTPRFVRHFNMLCIQPPSEQSLRVIFGSIFNGFLDNFADEVKSFGKPIVNASVELYRRMSQELLPTPDKSHYTFNLRDLSKLFQGLLQVRSVSPAVLPRLWAHESMRVFHDRLIDDHDKHTFKLILCDILKKHLDISWNPEALAGLSPLFGDFVRPAVPGMERPYEEITDVTKLQQSLENNLDAYNLDSSSNQLKLVFFSDAVAHISRISRILRQPRGNALLVGVGGSGKQSLTRLAAHMAQMSVFELELTKTYGPYDFHEDLKKLYTTAGVLGKPVVFLMTDSQIVHESFLEDINNILNSGEVPNLFEVDEHEKILNDVQPFARAAGIPDSRELVFAHFIDRVRDNLHIVLCMSPVGEQLRNRFRMFPSLVNCCTIDWFNEWPKEALLSVSTRFLAGEDLGISPEITQQLAISCETIHTIVAQANIKFYEELRRHCYTTPATYLDLINMFISMLLLKRKELQKERNKLKNGLDKLHQTNELVTTLQKELSLLQPELTKKAQATETLLKQIREDQSTADGVRRVVMEEEAVIFDSTVKTQALIDEAQRDLDQALPALDAAIKSLNSLNKNDISEIKSFTKPPELVKTVMEAVCILLQQKDTSWATSKSVLSDPNFMNTLFNFDKDRIPAAVLKKLKVYIDNPQFEPSTVAKVSVAAKSLCMWVRAMQVYSEIAKAVEPKRARVEEAQSMLAASKAKLYEKQSRLAEVEMQVSELKKKYEHSMAEKTVLSEKIQETSNKLDRASKLTTGLADEQVRWQVSMGQLDARLANIVGNTFLSAACIAYLGAFTRQYRMEIINSWMQVCKERNIPVSPDYSLVTMQAEPVTVRDWNVWGLPTDQHSTENGILATGGRRWPLLIDPQGQANRWIKNMEGKQGLRVIRLSDANYLRSLENSIRDGTPVLIEELGDTIDSALDTLLLRQTFKQGGRLIIRLGDSDVDYEPSFRLYMTTKSANPRFLPDIFIKTNVINCTVTIQGLEDQLLGAVVVHEQPEIEVRRNTLITSIAADKRQLKELEEKILKLLHQAEGSILDDEVLINTLRDSKETSNYVQERVKEAEETEQRINTLREQYRPVAIRGSILYFVIADLALIDPMYQFSLAYFASLFDSCIVNSAKSKNLEERLNTLITTITKAVFRNISRGLLEKDKMVFSCLIAAQIQRQKGEITNVEWNLLLRGHTADASSVRTDPNAMRAQWMTQAQWNACVALDAQVPSFSGLVRDLQVHEDDWRLYINSPEPQSSPLPGEWNKKLTPFQKLLLLKSVREEKLIFAFPEFITSTLDKDFIELPQFDLAKAFTDTSYKTPLIFILSTGADPTSALLRYAAERGRGEGMNIISLGQGQGPIAAELISRATKTGEWVLLQNCHLAASWMPALEKIVNAIAADTEIDGTPTQIHKEFRLLLSSMPTDVLPVSILQNGVKLTNEPPKGIRANLMRTFADMSETMFQGGAENSRAWKKLLFGLVFFHAVIQERKKFGPLGWNIKYEFNESDLQVSKEILQMLLTDHTTIPWDALRYLTGEISYGGRVTDEWDRRCLKSILSNFYSPQMLVDSYKLSESGLYYAPADGPLSQFKQYVEHLPYTEKPEVFGLHENANITYQAQETERFTTTILSIQPRLIETSSSGKNSGSEKIEILAKKILAGLPVDLTQSEGLPELFAVDQHGRMHPLSTFLLQEMFRFNKLLRVIRTSLVQIQKAIKGLVVMSVELEKMFNSLMDNQVPIIWANAAYPSRKALDSWVQDLHQRISFLRNWLTKGMPSCYWISGFFFPQGFLTGVLQHHARKTNTPVDSLSFSFEVVNTDPLLMLVPPEEGTYIYGLFMDGARWSKESNTLVDSLPGEISSVFPALHIVPKEKYIPDPKDYLTPIYKTSVRAGTLSTTGHSTNFIVAASLKTNMPPDYWVLKGVALLCQLDT